MRRRIRSILSAGFALFLLTAFLIFAREVGDGVREGISISLNIIVPSLFSFIVLSSFLLQSGYADRLLSPVRKPFARLFGVAPEQSALVFMSLIGGYPVGATLIAAQIRQKALSIPEAERMLCFCVNSGPAFLIGTIGIPLFGDLRIGLLLFAAHLLSALLIANLTRRGTAASCTASPRPREPVSGALIAATNAGCQSILRICALILVFSALAAILNRLQVFSMLTGLLGRWIPATFTEAALNGALEICRGCARLNALPKAGCYLLAAGLTAFAGLCVHMQIAAIVTPLGVSLRRFFRTRILYTASSVCFAWALLRVSRIALPTAAVHLSRVGTTAYAHLSSAFLLFLCVLLLLNVDNSVILKATGVEPAPKATGADKVRLSSPKTNETDKRRRAGWQS